MVRRLTRLARVCVLGTLVLALSGCLRYHVDLSVSADQRVSGTVVVAVKTTNAGLVGRTVSIPPDLADEVTTTDYDQDGYLGEKITLHRLTFAQAGRLFDQAGGPLPAPTAGNPGPSATAAGTPTAPSSPPGPPPGTTPGPPSGTTSGSASGATGGSAAQNTSTFNFRRDGDLVRVSGETNFPVFAFGGAGKDFDARITLTMPGEVVSTNGRRDGHTVTWRVAPDRPTRISAVARIGSSTPAWLPIGLAGGGAVLVLLVGLLAVSLVRRRRSAVPAGAAPVFDAAEFQTFLDDRSWYPTETSGPPPGLADPGGAGNGGAGQYPAPGQPPPDHAGHQGYPAYPGFPGFPEQGPPGDPGFPGHQPPPVEPGQQAQPPQPAEQAQPPAPPQPPQQGQWPPPYPETPHR